MTSARTADAVLDEVLAAGARRAATLGPAYAELWASLTRACEGGKRFRPALVVLAHGSLGGREPDAAARVGAAVELLHTAFVVHDDVIDGDHIRRGRPNVSGTFAATGFRAGLDERGVRTYSDTAGILAGDLALVAAVRTVATCGAPPEVTDRLLDLVDHAVHASAAGELDDVRHGLGVADSASLGDVLTVSERKTAVYSFALPLQAGAVLAGADDDVVDALGRIGRLLGIGFQLVDDVLGVFGDEAVTGKSALTDLREGKGTPLVAHARTTPAWDDLSRLVGDPELGTDGADRARALLTACGARAFVEDLAVGYVDTAVQLAYDHRMPETLLTELDRLAGRILDADGHLASPLAGHTRTGTTRDAARLVASAARAEGRA